MNCQKRINHTKQIRLSLTGVIVLVCCSAISPAQSISGIAYSPPGEKGNGWVSGFEKDSLAAYIDSASVSRTRARVCLRQGDSATAISEYARAGYLNSCDTCHADYDSAGTLSLSMGDYRHALTYLGNALGKGSRIALSGIRQAHMIEGDRYKSQRDLENAAYAYEKALDEGEDTLVAKTLLSLYSSLGRNQEIANLCTELLKNFPDFHLAKRLLFSIYRTSGIVARQNHRSQEAFRLFSKAMNVLPERRADILTQMGYCYEELNDTGLALNSFRRAVTDTTLSPAAVLEISRIYLRRGNTDTALSIFEKALNNCPADDRCWYYYSIVLDTVARQSEGFEAEKIAAKLGDSFSRIHLSARHIDYGNADCKSFPWLKTNPFTSDKRADMTYTDEADPSVFVGIDEPPDPLKQVVPEYPEVARRAGIEGDVWVRVMIGATGQVRRAIVLASSAEIFNDSAIQAATQFQFNPASIDGVPVGVWAAIPFHFKLNR